MLYRNAKIPIALLPPDLLHQSLYDRELDPALTCDVRAVGQTIRAVALAGTLSPGTHEPTSDLAGRMVLPGFIDAHTHLDKAHTWNRAPNRRGQFWDAIQLLADDKKNWTPEDLHARADFALRCAYAHGTVALRTHVDSPASIRRHSHEVMAQLRKEWAGRITLQTVPLVGLDEYSKPGGEQIADLALANGASALGGMPQMNPDLPRQLDRLLEIATERKIGLDLHVDENSNPEAETLRATAEAVLRNNFPYAVTCGHCCSLALQSPARQADTIAKVKAAGINIISLPLCNLYLQDRKFAAPDSSGREGGRTPIWRGITLVHEFIEAGVTIASASDNVRDAFYAFGDLDAFEVLVQSIRIGHLDTRLDHAPRLVTNDAAQIMGLPGYGLIAPGSPAELIVFNARSFSELLSRPNTSRELLSGETTRSAILPDYAELDAIVRTSDRVPPTPRTGLTA